MSALEILLVDDEPSIRLTVADTLRDAGHQVTTAADGREALEQIDERNFDLVISDIRLPKADGMTIFRKLRADFDAKGTAISDDELREQMDSFLAKAVAEVEGS